MDEFEELRRLLLGPEQDQLQGLRERLDDKSSRIQDVSEVLPQATSLSVRRGEDLSRALRPVVGNAIRDSITKEPQGFIDIFHPIIGALVRRSIAESFRGLMQSLNQALENTFSLQGLRWRFEAWRTGRSFAEVVLLRSLVYRVEQVFLIHRETGLLLLQVEDQAHTAHDPDMVASMLSAIQDFSRDSFQAEPGAALEEFRVGELEVWIESGPSAGLAAVIRGNPPRELRTTLAEALANAHALKGAELAAFKGDASVFEPLRPELEVCLRAQYHQREKEEKSLVKAWVALGAATAVVLVAAGFIFEKEKQWNDFTHRLRAEPGIAVTTTRKGWLRPSSVSGLRDPLSIEPATLVQQAGLDPAKILFDWKDYLAVDDVSVLRRVEKRFGTPAGAHLAIMPGGVLQVTGQAPYEWIDRVRREHPLVASVESLHEQDLKVTYDPALSLQRFQTAYPSPSGVTAQMDGETLHLSGKASPEWIAQVREGATHVPGIDALDARQLQTVYDPARVLQHFKDRFGLPDTANATMENGVLTLSGEASHNWLLRVRDGVTSLPGITSLDEHNVTDLDNTAFQQSKSLIEGAIVYFPNDRDDIAPEGFAALSRLPDEIRRCQAAAKHLNIGMTIEIFGSADIAGTEARNASLSSRRANVVRDFLVSCGFAPELFKASADPTRASTVSLTRTTRKETDRRVAFHVALTP